MFFECKNDLLVTLLSVFAFMPPFHKHPQTYTFSDILPKKQLEIFSMGQTSFSSLRLLRPQPFDAQKPSLCWPILPARAVLFCVRIMWIVFWMNVCRGPLWQFSCMKDAFCEYRCHILSCMQAVSFVKCCRHGSMQLVHAMHANFCLMAPGWKALHGWKYFQLWKAVQDFSIQVRPCTKALALWVTWWILFVCVHVFLPWSLWRFDYIVYETVV